MKLRCPGMDPNRFKPEDIQMIKCTGCSYTLEFWKDDVYIVCDECGNKNPNPKIESYCIAWCSEAESCLGKPDIAHWKKDNAARKDPERPS